MLVGNNNVVELVMCQRLHCINGISERSAAEKCDERPNSAGIRPFWLLRLPRLGGDKEYVLRCCRHSSRSQSPVFFYGLLYVPFRR